MLGPKNLRQYQWRAIKFIIEHPLCALFIDMGLGKTISVLSAIKALFHKGQLDASRAVLVIAPIRVIHMVWRQEALKWAHTRSLTFSLIHGSQKIRQQALAKRAHIYLVNPEGVKWLIEYIEKIATKRKVEFAEVWPFQMLVVDESTAFKDGSTIRFRYLRKILRLCERRLIMTGTPTPNSLLQLWAQMFIVDIGERLGDVFINFRERFFEQTDYAGYSYRLREESKAVINRLLRGIVLRLQDSDWLQMPKLVKNRVVVELPENARRLYKLLEEEMFFELDTSSVEALNAATLTGRCHQMANGAIYAIDNESEAKVWEVIHEEKIKALEELLDEIGERALITYTFKHDLIRLRTAFPDIPTMGKGKAGQQTMEEWKAGKHHAMFIHPQSASHGLNDLQINCRHVIFFSIPWSNEHHDQVIGRIGPARRTGEKEPTVAHYVMADDTVDEAIVTGLENRGEGQAGFLRALRDYRDAHR